MLCLRTRSLCSFVAVGHWRTLLAALAASLCGLSLSPSAEAQFYYFDDDGQRRYRRVPTETVRPRPAKRIEAAPADPAHTKKAEKSQSAEPDPPLYAVVSIEDQHVSVYGANGLIERSGVSTGRQSNPTPTGVFAIIEKHRWHESNLYSGAPMPFMQRVTWSGVAMHQGQLPGYPASHGCIRLPGDFAARWFTMSKLGLRVLISPSDIAPVAFTSPRLPVPRFWSVPAQAMTTARAPVQSAALSNETLAALAAPEPAGTIELNPVTFAAAEKAKAKSELKAAEQAEGAAGDALDAATEAVKDAAAEVRAAERAAAAAHARLAWFGYVGNRPPPPPGADFGEGLMVAIANDARANARLSQAQRADIATRDAAAAAAEANKQADARTEAAKERIAEMNRRLATVSVLISRKEERLYVRQGLREVFDAPVTIAAADQPLGTHIYMALPPAAGEKALHWTALSMPLEARPPAKVARLKRGSVADTGSIGTAIQAESAASALERIEIPRDVMDRLSELVWTGSSIIVTDHGLSSEIGLGTDFIVETRH